MPNTVAVVCFHIKTFRDYVKSKKKNGNKMLFIHIDANVHPADHHLESDGFDYVIDLIERNLPAITFTELKFKYELILNNYCLFSSHVTKYMNSIQTEEELNGNVKYLIRYLVSLIALKHDFDYSTKEMESYEMMLLPMYHRKPFLLLSRIERVENSMSLFGKLTIED